jgi:hypothetical protein
VDGGLATVQLILASSESCVRRASVAQLAVTCDTDVALLGRDAVADRGGGVGVDARDQQLAQCVDVAA